MPNIAPVTNGELQQQSREKERKVGNSLDKTAFLQLLVAQMKYQDPLEPTSNTEYVSQLATFSELEEMQNLRANSDMERASILVGQTVTVKSKSETGIETYDQGVVDYVTYENGKILLGINGSEYSLDDLLAVSDHEYVEAYSMAVAVDTALSKLPTIGALTLQDKDAVDSITKVYDEMNAYQKSFLSKQHVDLIEAYRARIAELLKVEGGNEESGDDNGSADTGEGDTDDAGDK